MPLTLKAKVESELDHLTEAGVWRRYHTESAAPVVVVPKWDGGVRLCGDYEVTVDLVLDIDQYSNLNPEDIFTSLAGGQRFTMLDLLHAYIQILLNEDL